MPIRGLTRFGLVLLCGMLGGCVTASEDPTADGVDHVVAGEPTFMRQTYMTMDERCRQVRRPTAVLTEKPRHGTVRMLTRKAKAVYGPGAHAHCDGRLGNSLAFEYTSAPDYRGRDGFAVRVRYSDGEIRHGRYEIQVR